MADEIRLNQLNKRLDELLHEQNKHRKEIHELKREINKLLYSRDSVKTLKTPTIQDAKSEEKNQSLIIDREEFERPPKPIKKQKTVDTTINSPTKQSTQKPPTPDAKPIVKESIESFIGGNLINKIGIIILVIGIGFFVKYAVDNNIIPAWMRIALGYVAGLSLVGLGLRFKEKYFNYSAVLLSGGIAVLYLTSYSGYAFFTPPVIPSSIAFATMELFTIAVVVAALIYDRQIIALVGMIGAYAVPILLSDGGGEMRDFFLYLSIINVGILVLSVIKNWIGIFIAAFGITWMAYLAWLLNSSETETVAILFAVVFYSMFFLSLLVPVFLKKSNFLFKDKIFTILNTVAVYAAFLGIVNNFSINDAFFSWFNLGLAVLHFLTAYLLSILTDDKKSFRLFFIIGILTLNIAFYLFFAPHIVTLLLLAQGVGFFLYGRMQEQVFFESTSFWILTISALSIFVVAIDGTLTDTPAFLNPFFGLMLLFIATFSGIYFLHHKWKLKGNRNLNNLQNLVLPLIISILLYTSINGQISTYHRGVDLESWWAYRYAWSYIFNIVFISGLLWINLKWWREKTLNMILLTGGVIALFAYWFGGFRDLDYLKTAYIENGSAIGGFLLRYVIFGLMAGLLYIMHRCIEYFTLQKLYKNTFTILIHLIILMALSHELITFCELFVPKAVDNILEIGLSILWAIYALVLVGIGFIKRQSLLRIAAITLFGITLVKFFMIDLADLSTPNKMIAFISLGVLLLIISYLYQRFKTVFTGDEDEIV